MDLTIEITYFLKRNKLKINMKLLSCFIFVKFNLPILYLFTLRITYFAIILLKVNVMNSNFAHRKLQNESYNYFNFHEENFFLF